MPQPGDELFQVRLEKLDRLRSKGIDPYPRNYDRSHMAKDALALFESEESIESDSDDSTQVSVAGRITAMRGLGKASFLDLLDGSGKIQGMLRRNTLGESYEILKDLDIGDWLGIKGPMFRTRTGEITVEVREFEVLAKSLRGLPEKFHGLTDTETRSVHSTSERHP